MRDDARLEWIGVFLAACIAVSLVAFWSLGFFEIADPHVEPERSGGVDQSHANPAASRAEAGVDEPSDGPLRQQVEGSSIRSLRVLTPSNDAVADARLFWVVDGEIEECGRTDADGTADVEARVGVELLVYHPDLAILRTIPWPADGVERPVVDVVCRPRPEVVCSLPHESVEALVAHTFKVVEDSDRGVLYSKLQRVVGTPLLRVAEWSGLSPINIELLDYLPCELSVRAIPHGADRASRTAAARLENVLETNTAVVRFEPPLQANPVNVTLEAYLEFPEDREVWFEVRGPLVGSDNPLATSLAEQSHDGGRTNTWMPCAIGYRSPGRYRWSALVRGLGTFDMGTFEVSPDSSTIRVRAKLELDQTVVVHLHVPSHLAKRPLFVFVRNNDLRGVYSETVQLEAEGTRELRLQLPSTDGLHVYAAADWDFMTRLVPVDDSGVRLEHWSERRRVSLSANASPMAWLEIRDRSTDAVVRSPAGSTEKAFSLADGDYSVRVVTPEGRSEPQFFTVPGETSIRVRR